MKAWRIYTAGGPEAFRLEDLPTPDASSGSVLIKVGAFGLNRSEWFTRIGESPSVQFPRVLGIECVGMVVSAPGGELREGQKVAAMMGGMGRQFDGSYAEYTVVPAECVFPIETALSWAEFAALPEMLQTCHGTLHKGLGLDAGQTLLIRGGTSSIGLTALAMAKRAGLRVLSTTRSASKVELLEGVGADEVLIDDGTLSPVFETRVPVDGVLELVGATTLLDSLRCVGPGGVVCMTGILGGAWELPHFRPMEHIPSGVRLTSYSGGAGDISASELQAYVSMVERGELRIQPGPVWQFNELPLAHEAMDANRANGKMVVVVG
ncbi:MAG: zinc-binding dehydrogenase [Myxococcales bacterium]|nr:zinc-binding dehydrogenase [Myxococcales bacterium]